MPDWIPEFARESIAAAGVALSAALSGLYWLVRRNAQAIDAHGDALERVSSNLAEVAVKMSVLEERERLNTVHVVEVLSRMGAEVKTTHQDVAEVKRGVAKIEGLLTGRGIQQ